MPLLHLGRTLLSLLLLGLLGGSGGLVLGGLLHDTTLLIEPAKGHSTSSEYRKQNDLRDTLTP